MESLRGKLLIATPMLADPNFARSVVLIAAHDDDGALGLILNRPLEAEVADAAPGLEPLAEPGAHLYVGGPVAPEAAVVLAEFSDPALAGLLVFDNVGLPAADCEILELAAGVSRAKVFAGHAGWGPGQLDDEIDEEAWIVGDVVREELWIDAAEEMWAAALERKGGQYALLARMPIDPSLN